MELEIVKFTDYREYLREVFASKQRANPRFSFRRFAAVVGFKSPNYLQMILDGRRGLSCEMAEQVAAKLKFSAAQRGYFVALVQKAAAKTATEAHEAERARLAAIKRIVAKDVPAAIKEVFGKWYYLLVRELFLLPNAKPDPQWIADRLNGLIDLTEAANALELLKRCGLLVQTDKGLRPADPVLDTNDDLLQASVMRLCHADTLKVWAQNLERLGPDQQELGVLNIPLDSRKIPELRQRIRRFQDEIIGWVQDEPQADCVVQLGTYLMPFSPVKSKP